MLYGILIIVKYKLSAFCYIYYFTLYYDRNLMCCLHVLMWDLWLHIKCISGTS